MKQPQPRPGTIRISPYVQGKSVIEGFATPIKLSSNESSHGPSPKALAAYHQASEVLHRYPDGGQWALREAIAEVHGLDAARIVCGNGSEELLGLLIRAYAGDGDEVLLSENGFVMCSIYTLAQGATPVLAPEREHRIDVDALLARVTSRTRIVCIANPNNPTGTYIGRSEVLRLHAGLPPEVLLVLDGAYAEFVMESDFDAGADLVTGYANVVMTRTFSKIYGLSGLRIGWAYCPPAVLDVLQRLRTPFNTNAAALAAAEAAVRDQDHIAEVRVSNSYWQGLIREQLLAMGLEVVPSVTNFYLIRFAEGSDKTAAEAAAFLQRRGIIPRPVGASNSLRITVGTEDENRAVLQTLRDYMAS